MTLEMEFTGALRATKNETKDYEKNARKQAS